MPSAAILDFEALLKPFEAPTASGKDLRRLVAHLALPAPQGGPEDGAAAGDADQQGGHRGAVAGLAPGGGEGDEVSWSTSPRTWRSAPT